MAYTLLLNTLIENSGLTVKEIAEKCGEYGVEITATYISKLRNDENNKSPSDKVSKAIAKACNAKHEDCLVLEAYLDRSPSIVNEFFAELKKMIIPMTMGVFENKFTTQQKKNFEKLVDELPIADLIFEIVEQNRNTKITKMLGVANMKAEIKSDEVNIKHEISQNLGFVVYDDGMSPQIKKGDKVQISIVGIDELETGDIICYTKGVKTKIFARKILISDKKNITLMPMNSEYKVETVKISDITILGKAVRVTTDL